MKTDRLVARGLFGLACLGGGIMVFLLIFLTAESLPLLKSHHLSELLFGSLWYPTEEPPIFGMAPLLVGSAAVTLLGGVIGLPLGLVLGIFMSEIAPRSLARFLKTALELLSFLPSVVLGLLAMTVLSPALRQTFNFASGLNWLNGSLMLALLMIPLVASLTQEALDDVDDDLRRASLALGATRFETIRRVTVPAAREGVIAALLLALLRAFGETMIVLMACGGAAVIPTGLGDPIRPITSAIAAEMGETAVGSPHYHALFFAGLILALISLCLSLAVTKRRKRT